MQTFKKSVLRRRKPVRSEIFVLRYFLSKVCFPGICCRSATSQKIKSQKKRCFFPPDDLILGKRFSQLAYKKSKTQYKLAFLHFGQKLLSICLSIVPLNESENVKIFEQNTHLRTVIHSQSIFIKHMVLCAELK